MMLTNANGAGGFMRRPNSAGNIFCQHCLGYYGPHQTCAPIPRRMGHLICDQWMWPSLPQPLGGGMASALRTDRRGKPIYRVKAGSSPA